MSNLNLH